MGNHRLNYIQFFKKDRNKRKSSKLKGEYQRLKVPLTVIIHCHLVEICLLQKNTYLCHTFLYNCLEYQLSGFCLKIFMSFEKLTSLLEDHSVK